MHYVYILYSASSDLFYVGQTPDMENRMEWHNQLGSGFTAKHRPWVVKAAFQVGDASTAYKMERYIKKKKSRAFVAQLTEDGTLWQYVMDKCSAG